MRFKLIHGTYQSAFGDSTKVFQPGAIIESDEDLVTKHPNMFELLDTPTAPVKKATSVETTEVTETEESWSSSPHTTRKRGK